MSAIHEGWLSGMSPAQWMMFVEDNWPKESAKEFDVPINPFSFSSWSILGTLSLIGGSTEVPKLHKLLGPHRMITKRHTQRLVKWLEEEKWINKQFNHIPFSDAKVFKLKQDRLGFGRLSLALWPLRSSISSWRREIIRRVIGRALLMKFYQAQRYQHYQLKKSVDDVFARLAILTSGHNDCPVPKKHGRVDNMVENTAALITLLQPSETSSRRVN